MACFYHTCFWIQTYPFTKWRVFKSSSEESIAFAETKQLFFNMAYEKFDVLSFDPISEICWLENYKFLIFKVKTLRKPVKFTFSYLIDMESRPVKIFF